MIYTDLLTTDKDPMGAAILDYLEHGKADKLRVFSSQFDEDEIPVRTLFRTEKQMAPLERTALQLATGRILDIGAGSGCHSLALQAAGKEVEAIDISPIHIYHSQPSYSKDQETFSRGPSVKVQEISAVVPPFHTSGCDLQGQRSQVLQKSAEKDGGKEFCQRVFTEAVQQGQDQYGAAAVNREPGTV